eukprot:SAG11_NODE_2341_length_3491_cov_2.180425_1_plen_700_part_00
MERLAAVQRHLGAQALVHKTPPTCAPVAAISPAPGSGVIGSASGLAAGVNRSPGTLLTGSDSSEDLLAQFAADGFVVLDQSAVAAQLPPGFHDEYHAQADAGSFPDPMPLLEAPAVREAFSAILGKDYVAMPGGSVLGYRGDANTLDQQFHKDPTMFAVREHRPEWCSLLYFPHEVTLEVGPFACIPGSHCLGVDRGTFPQSEERPDPWVVPPHDAAGWRAALHSWNGLAFSVAGPDAGLSIAERDQRIAAATAMLGCEEHKLVVPGGTVAICHDDLVHRRCRAAGPEGISTGEVPWRAMYKRGFMRGSEPSCRQAATGTAFVSTSSAPASIAHSMLWRWMLGLHGPAGTAGVNLGLGSRPSVAELELELIGRTRSDEEAVRIGAAYTLAALARNDAESAEDAEAAVQVLVNAMRGEPESARRAATHAIGFAGPAALPPLLSALLWTTSGHHGATARRTPESQCVVTAAAHALGHIAPTLRADQLLQVSEAVLRAARAASAAIDERLTALSAAQRDAMRSAAALPGPGGRGYGGAAYGSTEELDWDIIELRRTMCTSARGLGCVGQAAIAILDADGERVEAQAVETAKRCCQHLLTLASTDEDPGSLWPSMLNLSAARENAAHAMLRLCHCEDSTACLELPADPATGEASEGGSAFSGGGGLRGAAAYVPRLLELGRQRLRGGAGRLNAAQEVVLSALG